MFLDSNLAHSPAFNYVNIAKTSEAKAINLVVKDKMTDFQAEITRL
jgi:hypothetical protein